jgi:hypothetical protein
MAAIAIEGIVTIKFMMGLTHEKVLKIILHPILFRISEIIKIAF